MTPLERGIVAHLVADWILQNEWMAQNKISLLHPAAWVHAAIHAACLGLALGWVAGLVLGIVHVLIDTRVPVAWWIKHYKKCQKAPESVLIAMLLDQTVHITTIALWVALT